MHETSKKEKKIMGDRIQSLPEGVKKSSAWPYATMPEKKAPKKKSGGWILAIAIEPELNGLFAYYPAGTDFDVPEDYEGRTSKRQTLHIHAPGFWNGKKVTTKPFYRVDTKEQAEKFAVTFCSRGYSQEKELLPHSDGELWGFNWSSLTMATVAIASQVADHFFNDRYDEAWAVGKAFGNQVRAAENAEYDKLKKSA